MYSAMRMFGRLVVKNMLANVSLETSNPDPLDRISLTLQFPQISSVFLASRKQTRLLINTATFVKTETEKHLD